MQGGGRLNSPSEHGVLSTELRGLCGAAGPHHEQTNPQEFGERGERNLVGRCVQELGIPHILSYPWALSHHISSASTRSSQKSPQNCSHFWSPAFSFGRWTGVLSAFLHHPVEGKDFGGEEKAVLRDEMSLQQWSEDPVSATFC